MMNRLRLREVNDFINYLIGETARFWQNSALRLARQILQQEEIDCLFSTYIPYASHQVAAKLKKETGLPWLADFRDPWSQNIYLYPIYYGRWGERRRTKDRQVEQEVYNQADVITVVSNGMKRLILSGFNIPKHKVVVIPNGYEEQEFKEHFPHKQRPKQFKLVCTGLFYGGYNPTPVLKATELLVRENFDIEIEFIGRGGSWVKRSHYYRTLKDRITFTPYLNYEEYVKRLAEASAFFVSLPTEDHFSIPGKFYEFMRTGKPVLVVASPDSDIAQLVTETRCGVVVSPEGVENIAQLIKEWYTSWSLGKESVNPSWQAIARFDRKRLTGQLASLLQKLV
jgi:glycosyltransferase involved in cell wall biosynthesis